MLHWFDDPHCRLIQAPGEVASPERLGPEHANVWQKRLAPPLYLLGEPGTELAAEAQLPLAA